MEPENVTLRTADEKRKEAERQIREILTDLERRTGAWISEVSVGRTVGRTLGGDRTRTPLMVEVRIEI